VAPKSTDWWVSGLFSYQAALSAAQNGHDVRTVATQDGPVRVYSLRVSVGRSPSAVIQVGRSLAPEEEALDNLLHLLLFGGIGAVALGAGGGWFLAGRALVPVRAAFDRQKAFVGDASHELRTPLAVIKANAEFLQESQPANAEVADIVAEADRMSALVDSLLALARGEKPDGHQRERFDLGLVVETSVDTLKPLAEERGVALDVRHRGDGDLHVDGDREQIKQLMVILVDNALRYTGQGGRVAVDVTRTNGSGVVRVVDTGIGIAPESINHVFDRFYRADEARNRDSGGVGLGLAIARELVSDHGGRITAESRPGEGSTFTVQLPLA
ncbi:MAG TPA: HAMP domain-containing sensor histidine kinase, partial [Gaiellales bacterium]|nr:HAMP domain-containing sensor histidine kinase [Gaiellales bacterium]